MKSLKNLVLSAALLTAASFVGGASAQSATATATPTPPGGSVVSTATTKVAATAAAGDMTEAEVRKVDRAAGKVTLKHGEIGNLDMPAMTMVFQVRDVAALASLKAGDKVRFKAEKAGSAVVVTDIQPAK